MGATGGGVFKTTNAGVSWANVSDGFFAAGSIGTISAADSNTRVVYVGTGSAWPRGNISPGISMYKSTDTGASWSHIGLEDTGQLCLRDYWVDRLRQHDRIHWNTRQRPGMACGIANFDIPGVDLLAMNQWLFDEDGIVTHVTEHPAYTGFRITPNVFSTLEELDRFCDAIEQGMRTGIGA